MMVSSDTLKPVTLGLYGMVSLATFNDRGSLMMGALLGVLPVIVLFLGLQRTGRPASRQAQSRVDGHPSNSMRGMQTPRMELDQQNNRNPGPTISGRYMQ